MCHVVLGDLRRSQSNRRKLFSSLKSFKYLWFIWILQFSFRKCSVDGLWARGMTTALKIVKQKVNITLSQYTFGDPKRTKRTHQFDIEWKVHLATNTQTHNDTDWIHNSSGSLRFSKTRFSVLGPSYRWVPSVDICLSSWKNIDRDKPNLNVVFSFCWMAIEEEKVWEESEGEENEVLRLKPHSDNHSHCVDEDNDNQTKCERILDSTFQSGKLCVAEWHPGETKSIELKFVICEWRRRRSRREKILIKWK